MASREIIEHEDEPDVQGEEVVQAPERQDVENDPSAFDSSDTQTQLWGYLSLIIACCIATAVGLTAMRTCASTGRATPFSIPLWAADGSGLYPLWAILDENARSEAFLQTIRVAVVGDSAEILVRDLMAGKGIFETHDNVSVHVVFVGPLFHVDSGAWSQSGGGNETVWKLPDPRLVPYAIFSTIWTRTYIRTLLRRLASVDKYNQTVNALLQKVCVDVSDAHEALNSVSKNVRVDFIDPSMGIDFDFCNTNLSSVTDVAETAARIIDAFERNFTERLDFASNVYAHSFHLAILQDPVSNRVDIGQSMDAVQMLLLDYVQEHMLPRASMHHVSADGSDAAHLQRMACLR